jgi:hypothetical protein
MHAAMRWGDACDCACALAMMSRYLLQCQGSSRTQNTPLCDLHHVSYREKRMLLR